MLLNVHSGDPDHLNILRVNLRTIFWKVSSNPFCCSLLFILGFMEIQKVNV